MQLDSYIAELAELDDAEKLEWLIEVSDELPFVSAARLAEPLPAECRVPECQTAVHLWVDVVDGRVHIEADVPRNAPTVRGLVTVVVRGLEGATVPEVLAIPDDLLPKLGLTKVLGMQRQQGLRGVMTRIKRELRGT
ncbi:MAG: SufE family protein [Planctomycetaceae bacterium]|nr:SufE family protein [Planctomycetaceae bacterium]